MSNILIFTDAWYPQVNGVVTCYSNIKKELEVLGHTVKICSPKDFKYTISLPTYSEIKQPLDLWSVFSIVGDFAPDYVHIATPEGLVGWAGKLFCKTTQRTYSTSYHTKIPEYIKIRTGIPLCLTYLYERFMHKSSKRILVTTNSMKEELATFGLPRNKMAIWLRGVDLDKFSPMNRKDLEFKHPILLYVGRVSVEKNIESFLDSKVEGTKIVVGDGPYLNYLKNKYKDAIFTGYKFGTELSILYASADVFVFTSSTDTFGLVLLEAISSGTPVAAFDVPGPKDIIEKGVNGYLEGSIEDSINKCLLLDRRLVVESSTKWSWKNCTKTFLDSLKSDNSCR